MWRKPCRAGSVNFCGEFGPVYLTDLGLYQQSAIAGRVIPRIFILEEMLDSSAFERDRGPQHCRFLWRESRLAKQQLPDTCTQVVRTNCNVNVCPSVEKKRAADPCGRNVSQATFRGRGMEELGLKSMSMQGLCATQLLLPVSRPSRFVIWIRGS